MSDNLEAMNFFNININILAIISVFILGIVFSFFIKNMYSSFKMKRNCESGRKGEKTAIKLLKNSGFEVLRSQPKGYAYVWINGKMKTLNIRADYLIIKNGQKYVCEVKTGDVAGNILYKNTRRQLLEYYLFFELPIIFVDVNNKSVKLVEFALPN